MFNRSLETTVDILAPAEVVWAVLADTAAWSEWNPTLTKCEGKLEPGQRLVVTAQPPGRGAWTFKPTVLTGEGWGRGLHPVAVRPAGLGSRCISRVPPRTPDGCSAGARCARAVQSRAHAAGHTPHLHPAPAVEPNAELAWRGSVAIPGLFVGRHYFRLEADGESACRLVHGEQFSGLLLPLMGGMLADTEKGFHAMNAALKARAEARAGVAQE